MTEVDTVTLVHRIMRRKPAYFRSEGVVEEKTSWEPAQCPIVLAGPSLAKGAHAEASSQVIEGGHTVYFDFGVTLRFRDGGQWSSDIQRMGYVLRAGERRAPPEVARMFAVLTTAIEDGIRSIRPAMKGFEVDEIVRRHIKEAGFPDYQHSTGHAIGEMAHNAGTLLGPRQRRLARLNVQLDGVYTIEPRIAIENGGSIEEMVLVTKRGGVTLCPRQRSLYLVRASSRRGSR